VTDPRSGYPLGAALTLGDLEGAPYAALARLREREPVAWAPVLGGWLVTRRDLCIEVMRDATRFTVDDPRFSTAQVVGPSMLSLDGDEHRRHRDPFAKAFLGPDARQVFADSVDAAARRLVAALAPLRAAEIRRDLAGPLAVAVVAEGLGLIDVEPRQVLAWYAEIVAAVDRVSTGGDVGPGARAAVEAIGSRVGETIDAGRGVLAEATTSLSPDEIASNAAVMLFGGIETSEGMTTTLFWYLLTDPVRLEAVRADRSLIANAVEESLRLEPAASRVDRYATADFELAGARIRRGDLVIVSLTAANRDPTTFPDPDTFDVTRANARSHLTFAQGPHACVGLHLARLEAGCALAAALDDLPDLHLAPGATAPSGLIFRKPLSVPVAWS